jgi:hypothetical protein
MAAVREIHMERAIRLRVTVGDDHMIRLPDEVPTGSAEVIVFMPGPAARSAKAEARKRMFGRLRGKATIADDFDAPLPEEILSDFEGGAT